MELQRDECSSKSPKSECGTTNFERWSLSPRHGRMRPQAGSDLVQFLVGLDMIAQFKPALRGLKVELSDGVSDFIV